MKTRVGFVSNSSSSSFIVGIGVITDEDKFRKYQEKYKNIVDRYDVIDDSARMWSSLKSKKDEYVVEEPTNYGGEVTLSKSDYEIDGLGKDIAVLCHGNNEGDYAFYDDPDSEWPDVDYDIDLDFFPEDQQNAFDEFGKESGISFVDKTYGAGRNG